MGAIELKPALCPGAGSFLEPETQVLLYTIVVFLVLLAVLWRFAWGPLIKALEEREQRITRKIQDAETAHRQALEKMAEYERRIAGAKEEAAALIAQGKRDREKVEAEILERANAEAERALARARREIALAKEAALQELRDQMVRLTADLASRVIQREVRPDDHRRFIEDAIAQTGKAAGAAEH